MLSVQHCHLQWPHSRRMRAPCPLGATVQGILACVCKACSSPRLQIKAGPAANTLAEGPGPPQQIPWWLCPNTKFQPQEKTVVSWRSPLQWPPAGGNTFGCLAGRQAQDVTRLRKCPKKAAMPQGSIWVGLRRKLRKCSGTARDRAWG